MAQAQMRWGAWPACGAATLLALAACAGDAPPAAVAQSATTPPVLESPLGGYLAARHAQQEHDYADAADFMAKALAQDPNNPELLRRTFVLRVSEGHLAQALPLAKRVAELDPNGGLAAMTLLVEAAKSGDFADAADRARRLSSEGAQRLSGPLMLAWCEAGLGHIDAAQKALDRLKETHGVEVLRDLHAAMLADFADKVDAAADAYRKAVAEQSRVSWRTVEAAGNFYERHQRGEEARRLYERLADEEQGGEEVRPGLERIKRGEVPPKLVASAQDGLALALFDLASILDRRETLDASLIYVRLALELRPDFPLAQMLVGEIEEEQQHRNAALAVYRGIDHGSPLAIAAQLRAAVMLDSLDRTDEAVRTLEALAADRPHDPEPLVELGDILRGRSRFKEAVDAYDRAIARVPQIEPRHWRLFYSRAAALERSQQWPRAEADLKRALELQPDQPLVLNYLGYSWIDKGENLQAALKMIQRAVELRPNDGFIVDSLGWAYYRLGDYSNASQILEHAIELLPEDPTINDHLGDAYWQTGRAMEARFQWRRALQFKPEADEVKTIETKLDHGLARLPSAAARGG